MSTIVMDCYLDFKKGVIYDKSELDFFRGSLGDTDCS